MRSIHLRLVILFFSWVPCLTSAFAAGEKPPASVASKVTAVTVYADRALVTRSTKIQLAIGMTKIVFSKLPGWIDEGSVRVRVKPAGVAELTDVQVEKTFLAKAAEVEVRKAEAAVLAIRDQLLEIEDQQVVLISKKKHVDGIKVFTLAKLPKDAHVKDFKIGTYKEVVEFISTSLLEIAKAQRVLEIQKRELLPQLGARQLALNELRQRSQLEERAVVAELKSSVAKSVSIELVYMVPGATWEPVHELRSENGKSHVKLASYAIITQTTGEDWLDARLTFSTQRPSDTLHLPELKSMLVGAGSTLASLQMVDLQSQQGSFEKARSGYLAQRDNWNRAQHSSGNQQEVFSNNKRMDAVQKKVQLIFKRVQERGTSAHFSVQNSKNVRTNGRPVRLLISATQLKARYKIMAAPELSLNAIRTVELTNTSSYPLLPGKVNLYVDNAFLGMTRIKFTAQGEAFALYLGVDDRIKLKRTFDRSRSSLDRSGSRHRMHLSYLVSVKNLSSADIALQLKDRIPVAQSKDVRIKNVRISPEILPDAKGLVHWKASLAPKGEQTFRVEYTLEYPESLLARISNQRKGSREKVKKGKSSAEDMIHDNQHYF